MTGGVFKQIGEHVRCMISSLINLILYVMLSIVKGTTEGSNGPLWSVGAYGIQINSIKEDVVSHNSCYSVVPWKA